jgi:endoglucanase
LNPFRGDVKARSADESFFGGISTGAERISWREHPLRALDQEGAMKRRDFLKTAAMCGAGAAMGNALAATKKGGKMASYSKLPRWRGFNLLEKFTLGNNAAYREEDFDLMAGWGFDFARLPMDYRCWTAPDDPKTLKEETLKEIDRAVEMGRKRGIHVNLNFHRAPGYCVNPPAEPLDLWTQPEALELASYHWGHFAARYKDIPNSELSFDLLNEPPDIPAATYRKVVDGLIQAIRAADPDRLIIADGRRWGNTPVPELADLKVGQSTRGYQPMQISHYKAGWVHGSDQWPEPTWPLKNPDIDKEWLRKEMIAPWKALEAKGVGVHVGEWGAFQYTPHAVVMAWMKDTLSLWKEAGWGWAMWNLRGGFGPLDSGRSDVKYEKKGDRLVDREMLELIRAN